MGEAAGRREGLGRKLRAVATIHRKVNLRRGLSSLNAVCNVKIKKICGFKNLVGFLKNKNLRSAKDALALLKSPLHNLIPPSAGLIFRTLNRQIQGTISYSFHRIKQTARKR